MRIKNVDIDLRQTKYRLPAIMYIPVFIVGCLIINIFWSPEDGKAETKNTGIDTNVPEANVDSILGGRDADAVDYGDAEGDLNSINDSAVSGSSVDASFGNPEDRQGDGSTGSSVYPSSVSGSRQKELAAQEAERAQLENFRQMQNRVRSNRSSSSSSDDDDDYIAPLSSNEIARAQQRRRERILRDLDNDIYGARERQTASGRSYGSDSGNPLDDGGAAGGGGLRYNADGSVREPDYYDRNGNPVYAGGAGGSGNGGGAAAQGGSPATGKKQEEKPVAAVKVKSGSDYFNTIAGNSEESSLITAIIDENIKAVEGSRVRIKLLDDIEVGGHTVKKGTRLYVTMTGFGSQRVKGNVESILVGDKIIRTELAIYDMDGIEGLYVPESSFREFRRDIGGGLASGSSTITGSSTIYENGSNPLKSWGASALQNSSQRAMDAIQKRIQKNVVKLKFGTRIYLINSKDIEETSR